MPDKENYLKRNKGKVFNRPLIALVFFTQFYWCVVFGNGRVDFGNKRVLIFKFFTLI